MKTIKIKARKCRQSSKDGFKIIYLYSSIHSSYIRYTVKEIEAMEKIELVFTEHMKEADKNIIRERWSHKL